VVKLPAKGKIFTSSPKYTDKIWGTPSLLFNGYSRSSPWKYSTQGMKLTAHLLLMHRLRMSGASVYLCSPTSFLGIYRDA